MNVGLVVNGETFDLEIDPDTRLVDVLRDQLGLTGAKDACRRGDCGACTVLVGGRTVLACLTLAARVDDEVMTAEGLAADLEPLRRALADCGGLQCGYCTPGLVVRCSTLAPDHVDSDHVRTELAGNFCRCTGYQGILAALNRVEGSS